MAEVGRVQVSATKAEVAVEGVQPDSGAIRMTQFALAIG